MLFLGYASALDILYSMLIGDFFVALFEIVVSDFKWSIWESVLYFG